MKVLLVLLFCLASVAGRSRETEKQQIAAFIADVTAIREPAETLLDRTMEILMDAEAPMCLRGTSSLLLDHVGKLLEQVREIEVHRKALQFFLDEYDGVIGELSDEDSILYLMAKKLREFGPPKIPLEPSEKHEKESFM